MLLKLGVAEVYALGVICINFIISYKGVITGVIDVVQYMKCVPR